MLQMAERTLGKVGGTVIGLIYQFYSYASILAYVAGIGEVVSLLVKGALTSAQGQVKLRPSAPLRLHTYLQ
jgi:amino acid permease